MRLRSIGTLLLVLILGALVVYNGCAPQQQQTTEKTPEQLAAERDSIAKVNDREMRMARSFGYEKYNQGDWIKAREYFWKMEELDVTDKFNEWDRIYDTYLKTDQPDSAEIVLRMGLEEHPEDPYLNATLGFFLKAKQELEPALDLYLVALESEPENVEYLRKTAEIYEGLGQYEKAIETYERLLAVKPEDVPAKESLTSLVRSHRDPMEYIARLEEDVADNPDNIEKQAELVHAYQGQQMNEKVVAQADVVLAMDPTRKEVYRAKAKAQENLNRLDAAIATYKDLLEQYPEDHAAMLRIADNSRQLGQFNTARVWINRARSAAGGSLAEADYILGLTYESSGDRCSSSGLDYDDRLVFVIAYGLFNKAAGGDDYAIKERAQSRANYLEQFVPKKSDWFLNQTKELPQKDCYGWITPSWPEVGYIQTFLNRFE